MALASENLVAQHRANVPRQRNDCDAAKKQHVKNNKPPTPVRRHRAGQPVTVHNCNAHENGLHKNLEPQRPPHVHSAWSRLPVVRQITTAHAAFPHLRHTLTSHGHPQARDDRVRLHPLRHPQVDHGEPPPLLEVRHVLDLAKVTLACSLPLSEASHPP